MRRLLTLSSHARPFFVILTDARFFPLAVSPSRMMSNETKPNMSRNSQLLVIVTYPVPNFLDKLENV